MKELMIAMSGCILLVTINYVYGEDGKAEVATFAGGCFWCMEPAFDALDGVMLTTVGHTEEGRKELPRTRRCLREGRVMLRPSR